MDIVKHLEEDHKRIIKIVNQLPAALLKAKQSLETLLTVSNDLEKELTRHEKIEDDLLFPALREKISKQTLQTLTDEHAESKKARDLFIATIAEVKNLGENKPPEKIKEMSNHGYKLMRILSTHLTREDQLLFPMAKSILSNELSEELEKQSLSF
ncbi:MAG: hemerythrin domain-containing protein [Nitrospirae bacterium]|nr:hemerythrin domain-containing protein [Nitrospirota bacterium]MBI3352853.1 hemerythrin domain-containing protein [Nitrospirota bacterium]